jgi:homoserine trans-succinylase
MVDYEAEGKVMPDFNALDKSKQKELPVWAVRQQKVFTNWVNNKVSLSTVRTRAAYDDSKVLQGFARRACVSVPRSAHTDVCSACKRALQQLQTSATTLQPAACADIKFASCTEHLCRTQDTLC